MFGGIRTLACSAGWPASEEQRRCCEPVPGADRWSGGTSQQVRSGRRDTRFTVNLVGFPAMDTATFVKRGPRPGLEPALS